MEKHLFVTKYWLRLMWELEADIQCGIWYDHLFSLCGNLILPRVGSILPHDMHDQHRDRDELFRNISSAVEKVRIYLNFLEDKVI